MSDEYLEAAAKRAIELGWTCDGHEPRDNCDICMGLWKLHLPELFEVWVGDRDLVPRSEMMSPVLHSDCLEHYEKCPDCGGMGAHPEIDRRYGEMTEIQCQRCRFGPTVVRVSVNEGEPT